MKPDIVKLMQEYIVLDEWLCNHINTCTKCIEAELYLKEFCDTGTMYQNLITQVGSITKAKL